MNVNNTNVTVGVFEGDSLRATWRFATDVRKTGDEYGVLMLDLLTHDGVSQRYFNVKPLVVGTGVRTGLRLLYDSPREVGADRVADAVAAIQEYGTPLIV